MKRHKGRIHPSRAAARKPNDVGSKQPGEAKETHETTFLDTHLLELDLDTYVDDFNRRVIGAYQQGTGSITLPADVGIARSLIPPGTAALRDFSYIAVEIPQFLADKCVGCMSCVTECPDTAILGKAIPASRVEQALTEIPDPEEQAWVRSHWVRTRKYFEMPEKKGQEGALFGIFIDPTKCKGCAECVQVCDELDYHALEMVKKDEATLPRYRNAFNFFRRIGPTPQAYINERALADFMLAEASALLYVGGAGSCMGCGEATAIRMMLAATGFVYGPEKMAIVAATGCNTVYGSTYPYNPFLVPWTNSLFENAPAVAMGIRDRWDQQVWHDKKLWVIGGTIRGKREHRKELGQICLMHPEVYVAQTTPAHINHFYKAIMEANEYPGPALINVFTTCQPEHGVADDMAAHQANVAVESRAFPLFVYDPRKGKRIRERLSLVGNPAQKEDWWTPPNSDKPFTFIDFASTEGRFAKQFDAEGNPSEALQQAQEDRLNNWQLLQELAGLR